MEIYHKYRGMLYRVASEYFRENPAAVEDAVSTALAQMCRYVERLREVNEAKMGGYILSLIRNVCRRQYARQKKLEALMDLWFDPDAIDEIPDTKDPYATAFDYRNAIDLLNALKGLKQWEKELIRMRYIDQMEYSEMAELLNRPEASVRSALYRAKAHARKIAMERKDELF